MFDNWISSMSTLIPIPSHWLNNDPPAPIGQRMKEKMNVNIIVESGSAVIRLSGSNRVSGTKVVYMMLDFLYIAVPTSFQQHLAVLIICQSNNLTSTFSDAVQGFVHRFIPWLLQQSWQWRSTIDKFIYDFLMIHVTLEHYTDLKWKYRHGQKKLLSNVP